jgi:hypothetical protein
VEEKNPGDQNSLRQYISLTQENLFRICRLVFALILPTMLETEYLGSMTMTSGGVSERIEK